MACFGWLRFFNSLQLWNMLEALGLKVSPLYLAASGAFWALLGLCNALSLFFGWRHAAWLARLGAVAAALLYWVDDLWLTDGGASHAGRPFAIVLTLLLLALVFSVLELPAQKAFFARRKF